MSELSAYCEKNNVKAVAAYSVKRAPWDDGKWPHTAYRVTLRFQSRRLTVDFFCGTACNEPTAADVLSCLISDSNSADSARDFGDWCADFGYDTDSRKAEAIYKQCKRMAIKLHQFLGDAYDCIANLEH